MNRTYSCSGTLGDAYITVCILYETALREKVTCNHYTVHRNWCSLIREIYSLLPGVEVNFVDDRDMDNARIHSDFDTEPDLPVNFFPDFAFPGSRFGLPDRYLAMSPRSGRREQTNRIMNEKDISKFAEEGSVVLVGDNPEYAGFAGDNVINLIGQTSLLEAMGIVKSAEKFVGFQGLMCYVAMSQKVPTIAYVGSFLDSFKRRRPEPWHRYCLEIR